jgi:hypothetical protein
MAPNGTIDDSVWERWHAVFSPIVDDLNEFGRRHGLFVEPFYHNAPIWHFLFRKRAGGTAMVGIGYDPGPDKFHVSGTWWIDEYESVTRRFCRSADVVLSIPVDHDRLSAALEETLGTVKSWGPTSLAEQAGPYPEWREKYGSKEEFRKPDPKYPLID